MIIKFRGDYFYTDEEDDMFRLQVVLNQIDDLEQTRKKEKLAALFKPNASTD